MIDQQLQNRIEDNLKKYRGFTPIEIAKDLNIKIAYVQIDDKDFSGAIKKSDDDGIYIFVNKNDPQNRQLFTIAHELGHFFMHNKDVVDEGIVSYRDGALYTKYDLEQRKREEEANHFAAELLMPKELFIEYYKKHSKLNLYELINKMANFFGVSEHAIKIRMSYLDLI